MHETSKEKNIVTYLMIVTILILNSKSVSFHRKSRALEMRRVTEKSRE